MLGVHPKLCAPLSGFPVPKPLLPLAPMVHLPSASYQPDGARPEESIFDWFLFTRIYLHVSPACMRMLRATLNERFCNSHQVYHAYLMKAHQFIKDYNIEDEEGKETFLNVFGQNDDPEDDLPNPEDDLLEDDP